MNRLKQHIVYLAGAIDNEVGAGRGWREEITPFLHNLGVGVFNPCDKPIHNTNVNEDGDFLKFMSGLKQKANYGLVSDIMQEIVRIDLKLVDLANFMIVNINPDIHMCGTYSEVTYACQQRKPVLVLCQDKTRVPNWLFGLCDHELFFETVEQLKDYVSFINSSSEVDDMDRKWRFINYNKVFGVNMGPQKSPKSLSAVKAEVNQTQQLIGEKL